jgi:hypothetical protein
MIRGLDFTHIREEKICEKRSPCTYEKLQELPSLWASTYGKLSLYFKDYMFKIQTLMVLVFHFFFISPVFILLRWQVKELQ